MERDPVDLLFHLAKEVQLLVCISWLAKFQVLACIPPCEEVAFEDVVETTAVPLSTLLRVVRLSATADFLCEPKRGFVAHTPLSLQYFQRPSLLDAAMYLCDTVTPAALKLATGSADMAGSTLGGLQSNSHQQQPALRRQMQAFHRLGQDKLEASVIESLLTLDWKSLGQATVVEVGPQSPAIAFALLGKAPQLNIVLQSRNEPGAPRQEAILSHDEKTARIEMHHREEGQPQNLNTADIYILHLPATTMISASSSSQASVRAELNVHFELLCTNKTASLIIVALVLPDVGHSNPEAETMARVHDLTMLQLANEETMDMVGLENLIRSTGDERGQLEVSTKLSCPSRHSTVAILETFIMSK